MILSRAAIAAMSLAAVVLVWRVNQRPEALPFTPAVPVSHDQVAISPRLADAYVYMQESYGADFLLMLDTKLERRARLAGCGVRTPGAVRFVVTSSIAPDHSHRTVERIEDIDTTYRGAMDSLVRECLEEYVVSGHETLKWIAPPAWMNEYERAAWLDSPYDHEQDVIRFPIEQDELYRFFDGDISAFRGEATQTEFFP